MESQKNQYRRWGWFVVAATIVALILANAVHASMPILIILGVIGFGGGIFLITLAERRL